MAETVEYQKPVAGHVTSRHIFFIHVFWSQYQNGIFKGKFFFLQQEVHYLQTFKHNFPWGDVTTS